MRRIILGVLVMSAALAGGCTASGTAYYGGGGTLTATTVAPDLVYVSPGVQVVADYDYPVFYADNFYWRFDSGRWYRSATIGLKSAAVTIGSVAPVALTIKSAAINSSCSSSHRRGCPANRSANSSARAKLRLTSEISRAPSSIK